MYGLEGILGNIITGAATPAVGAVIKDATSADATKFAKGIFGGMDEKTAQTLGGITSGTAGVLGGALVGAGLGALTGGKRGAGMGALTGGIGAGYGAFQSKPILQSLGMGQDAAQAPLSPMDPRSITSQTMQQAAASANTTPNPQDITNQSLSTAGGYRTMGVGVPPQAQQAQGQTQPGQAKETPNYLQLAALPAMLGMQLGSSAQDMDYAARAKKHQQQQAAQQQEMLSNLIGGMYQPIGSYAAGGPLEFHGQGPAPSTVHIPESAVDGFIRSGGIASLEDHYASGGFINTANPQTMHPQSYIPKAQPYIAASPQRREVLGGFAEGGLLEGEGDGMSDNIPANIDGQEEVRVADGEYVVPRSAAHGREAQLRAALTAIRKAAHPEHGKQIKQDAAKRAFMQTMTRVKM